MKPYFVLLYNGNFSHNIFSVSNRKMKKLKRKYFIYYINGVVSYERNGRGIVFDIYTKEIEYFKTSREVFFVDSFKMAKTDTFLAGRNIIVLKEDDGKYGEGLLPTPPFMIFKDKNEFVQFKLTV